MILAKQNPINILLYFICNIVITMITKNPVYISISFFSVVIYSLVLKRPNKIIKSIIVITIIVLISVFSNPFFNSNGDTSLFTIGKTIFTLESMFYGLIATLMLVSIVLWFRNYNILMTSDKFLYIFRGYFPNISLIISMILSLIPEMMKKIKDLKNSLKTSGLYSEKGIINRFKSRFLILGNIFSWTMENSLMRSISMKARGYGLKGKTNYIIYKYRLKDFFYTLLYLGLSVLIILLNYNNLVGFSFYPLIDNIDVSVNSIISYILFFVLANTATFLNVKENIKWHYLKLKISHSHMH